MIKCLAQGHKCHGRDSNPHSVLTPELESGKLDRSATTLQLHWLPIREQIHFKFFLFINAWTKLLLDIFPTLLSHYTPPRFLRSTLDITHLNVPRANKFIWLNPLTVIFWGGCRGVLYHDACFSSVPLISINNPIQIYIFGKLWFFFSFIWYQIRLNTVKFLK